MPSSTSAACFFTAGKLFNTIYSQPALCSTRRTRPVAAQTAWLAFLVEMAANGNRRGGYSKWNRVIVTAVFFKSENCGTQRVAN